MCLFDSRKFITYNFFLCWDNIQWTNISSYCLIQHKNSRKKQHAIWNKNKSGLCMYNAWLYKSMPVSCMKWIKKQINYYSHVEDLGYTGTCRYDKLQWWNLTNHKNIQLGKWRLYTRRTEYNVLRLRLYYKLYITFI